MKMSKVRILISEMGPLSHRAAWLTCTMLRVLSKYDVTHTAYISNDPNICFGVECAVDHTVSDHHTLVPTLLIA